MRHIRKINILCSILVFSFFLTAAAQTEIRVNLAGYNTHLPKKVLLMSKSALEDTEVILRKSDGKVAAEYSAKVEENGWLPFEHYYAVDFTDFIETGEYYFELVATGEKSKTFEIGSYPKWQEDVVSFIRTQRCGFNPVTGEYCHQDDGMSFFGLRPDSTRVDATGGWHDAADQLKYLITSSNTTARLLMTYQMQPTGFQDLHDAMGLPEPNQLPDILDEAKWGLEWILKLHPSSNELYHQVADDRDHAGFKLPHLENVDYGWGVNKARPAYFATGKPQGLSQYKSKATGVANLAGRSAATLALGYQVF